MSSFEDRIAAFESVRDMPYRIDLLNRAEDRSCITKAVMLCNLLRDFGIEARRTCCQFKWDVELIKKELFVRPMSRRSIHVYLKVRIPETGLWADVDPTWDIGLKNAGFKIAEWNGINATALGVKPDGDMAESQITKILEIIDSMTAANWRELNKFVDPFVTGMNNWLDRLRSEAGAPHA